MIIRCRPGANSTRRRMSCIASHSASVVTARSSSVMAALTPELAQKLPCALRQGRKIAADGNKAEAGIEQRLGRPDRIVEHPGGLAGGGDGAPGLFDQ